MPLDLFDFFLQAVEHNAKRDAAIDAVAATTEPHRDRRSVPSSPLVDTDPSLLYVAFLARRED